MAQTPARRRSSGGSSKTLPAAALARSADGQPGRVEHEFVPRADRRAGWCEVCDQLIWGLAHRAFEVSPSVIVIYLGGSTVYHAWSHACVCEVTDMISCKAAWTVFVIMTITIISLLSMLWESGIILDMCM